MPRKPWVVLVCVLTALSLPGTVFAASGDRDRSFHGDGVINFEMFPGGGASNVNSVVSHEGKVVLAGNGGRVAPRDSDVFIARLGPNGFLDGTCNGKGFRLLDLGGIESVEKGLAVLPSDKMLLAGYSTSLSGSRTDLFLARFLPNCRLDPKFAGGNGLFRDNFGYRFGAFAYGLAVLPNRKIIVVGEVVLTADESQLAVWRFNKNGTLDSGFGGGDGLATLDVAPGKERARQVIVLDDGKLLVGGWAAADPPQWLDVMLARFHPDGRVDREFGVGGSVVHDPTAEENEYVNGMAVWYGKIIVCVNGRGPTDHDVVLMRLNRDGTRDSSWAGGDGERAIDFGGREACTDLVLDADGKIVVGGSQGSDSLDWLVARFLTSGDPDLGFGTGGSNTAAIRGGAHSIALDGAGRILLGGYDVESDFAAARFLP